MKQHSYNLIGNVTPFVHDIKTGLIRPLSTRHNIETYMSADIMARLVGGDLNYIPKYVGFVYGVNATPGAALIEPPVSRIQTWSTISAELVDPGVAGNVLITPLAADPKYSLDGSSSYYTANSVTLAAHSGIHLEYGFPVGAPYADALIDGDYFYQAILLARIVGSNGAITYLPFARVSLVEGSSYPAKATGSELGVFWPLTFF